LLIGSGPPAETSFQVAAGQFLDDRAAMGAGMRYLARHQILDVLELEGRGPDDPVAAEGLEGTVQFFSDLCHTQAAAAAGEVSRICDHLTSVGASAMEMGGFSVYMYLIEAREELMMVLDRQCGSRLTTTLARVGGMSHDLYPAFDADIRAAFSKTRKWLDEVGPPTCGCGGAMVEEAGDGDDE